MTNLKNIAVVAVAVTGIAAGAQAATLPAKGALIYGGDFHDLSVSVTGTAFPPSATATVTGEDGTGQVDFLTTVAAVLGWPPVSITHGLTVTDSAYIGSATGTFVDWDVNVASVTPNVQFLFDVSSTLATVTTSQVILEYTGDVSFLADGFQVADLTDANLENIIGFGLYEVAEVPLPAPVLLLGAALGGLALRRKKS